METGKAIARGVEMMKPVVLVCCSCHGNEVMAQLVGDNLVLRKRIHGREHVLLTKVADGCILEITKVQNSQP